MAIREIPRPTFERDVDRVVKQYENALLAIQRELSLYDVSDASRAHALATAADIGDILTGLNVDVSAIIEEIIPKAANVGVAQALVSIGAAATLEEATQLAKFGKLNKNLVAAVIADTQDDLLAVTQNVDRQVKTAMRSVASEVLRENTAKGINGTQSLSSDVRKKFRNRIGTGADTAIIDAAGRRWKLKTYTDMLVRTKMLEAHKEAAINEAIERDIGHGIISSHGAKDACANHEGKIVKLVDGASGDYPYIGDLPRSEIFHPNCRHVVTPVRNIARLTE